jgi:hypothetical protein
MNDTLIIEPKNSTDINNAIEELAYRNYRYNRQRSPGIPAKDWGKIFGNAEVYEIRYQKELKEAVK